MVNRAEIEARIRQDALEDDAFHAALLDDAGAAIARHYGIGTPAGLSVRALAEGPGEIVLILPSTAPIELDDDDLDAVDGAGYTQDPNDDGEGTG